MSHAFESQRYNRGELVTSFCVRLSLEMIFIIVVNISIISITIIIVIIKTMIIITIQINLCAFQTSVTSHDKNIYYSTLDSTILLFDTRILDRYEIPQLRVM